ncbi:MAG: hypothetical protein LBI10_08090 [Deltaproteobacteria bacterium]|jgi:hypothetical protein|nr:hypothetical protein [Deltaproteobacteria bacterium]
MLEKSLKLFVPIALFAIIILGFWLLWNALVPGIFGFKDINYLEAIGVFVLTRFLLFGVDGLLPRSLKDSWRRMSPSERKEFLAIHQKARKGWVYKRVGYGSRGHGDKGHRGPDRGDRDPGHSRDPFGSQRPYRRPDRDLKARAEKAKVDDDNHKSFMGVKSFSAPESPLKSLKSSLPKEKSGSKS